VQLDQLEQVEQNRSTMQEIVLEEAGKLFDRPVPGTEHFFRAGGDSLMAARLAAVVTRRTSVKVSVASVFRWPILDDLAREWAASLNESASAVIAAPKPADGDDSRSAAPTITFQQRRRLQRDAWAEKGKHQLHHVAVAFEIRGAINATALEEAANDLVRRHDILSHGFGVVGGEPAAWPLKSFPRMVEEKALPAGSTYDDATQVLRSAHRRLFDLASDAKLRLTVVTWGEPGRCLLGITVEHLCCDGESVAPLLHDLGVAYSARIAGASPRWSGPVPSFQDWVRWELGQFAGDELPQRLAHWRSRLDPLAPVPYAYLRGSTTPRDLNRLTAGRATLQISEPDCAEFRAALRARGSTLYMGVCAATTLACVALGSAPLVGILTPIANRPEEWRNSVGWTSTTGIVRVDAGMHRSLGAVLDSVRDELALTYDHVLPISLLLSSFTPDTATDQLWRPRLYIDVASDDPPILDIAGAETRYLADAAADPSSLRHGISLWVTVGAGLELHIQYVREHLPEATADSFISCIAAAIKKFKVLLPMTVAEGVDQLAAG
jgi:condensation domain-containing protein/phosphopantetheine binding protein